MASLAGNIILGVIWNAIKYEGPNNVLVWKWRSEKDVKREGEIRLGSQLVVNESQEAIFYKGGKALDIFGPGTHMLSTNNLPLLSSIIGHSSADLLSGDEDQLQVL
ncbi:MAG: SPFH domain-containing protein [Rectinemataceae bacterium]|jgi:membrane protease subunit (stomatin/prohibitin family)